MTNKKEKQGIFSSLGQDMPAALVVFLVALPLCLGIALASKAPPFAGLIAGIVGGIIVGAVSGSHVSVSVTSRWFDCNCGCGYSQSA